MFKILYTVVFWLSLILLAPSIWLKDKLPSEIVLSPRLEKEPVQAKTSKTLFPVKYGGSRYLVTPQYRYDLYGLVVSFKQHSGDMGLHKRWNDHINAADVCVLWGDSAKSLYLKKIKFWNGEFTCNWKSSDRAAWDSLKLNEVANNHLITEDERLRKLIKKVRVGDQIHINGWLSSYEYPGGGRRGTSTVRTDTGNGACETIYVKRFEITRAGHNRWRYVMYGSLLMMLLTTLLHFVRPFKPH